MKSRALCLLLLPFFGLALSATAAPGQSWLEACDVIWNSPSKDARGSMPLGNGEVTLNAWVEPNGDLQFYVGRSDSYSEISRLLKVGLVRVHLSPNPFQDGQPFSQRIRLRDGIIEISGGRQLNHVDLRIFTDPAKPVIYLKGEAALPESVEISIESWREQPRTINDDSAWTMQGAPHPLIESADIFPSEGSDAIAWYHRNETTVVPETLAHQGLTNIENAAALAHDPLLHRTFGGYIAGKNFSAKDARSLVSKRPLRSFSIRIASPCKQTETAEEWTHLARDTSDSCSDSAAALRRNTKWWREYWQRSWVEVMGTGEASLITRACAWQRFMQACGGRGALPIKFNGGAFTLPPDGDIRNSDFRRWGDCHWFQNIRHMYYPMMESGDFEMTDPFFRMYESVAALCEARAKLYEGVNGVYFPETMTVWGTYANKDYDDGDGWNHKGRKFSEVLSPWWGKTRNQGPELVGLMLDRWDYTQDKSFLRDQVLPMASAVLSYFDQRFHRDSNGRLILAPTQSVETYWEDVTNDMPTIAGLRNICPRLCALPPQFTTSAQRELFQRMLAACPELPIETRFKNGTTTRLLAPAQHYIDRRHNVENPELYAVWPFDCYGLAQPDLQLARDSYSLRHNHLDVGWGPDGNCAAVLGLSNEAARILKKKCANSNPAYRWPATWGPNFDWMPDQNHGGNLLNTAQLMLLHSEGRKILLFPAWPRDWNVNFKLHASLQTTVEATLKDGKLIHLKVNPASRARDIVNELDPQRARSEGF